MRQPRPSAVIMNRIRSSHHDCAYGDGTGNNEKGFVYRDS